MDNEQPRRADTRPSATHPARAGTGNTVHFDDHEIRVLQPKDTQSNDVDKSEPPIKPLQHHGTFASQNSTDSFDQHWVRQNVLSLDGGGVRGYSTLLILEELMEKIATMERNYDSRATSSFHSQIPGPLLSNLNEKELQSFYPCHYFDYMFGTSTGGLIAILLGRIRLTVKEALRVYEDLAGEVFGKKRLFSIRGPLLWPQEKYDHQRLENVIKSVVNAHLSRAATRTPNQVAGNVFNPGPTFNSEPSLCRTVCVAYLSRGKRKNSPFLFRSYEHTDAGVDLVRNPGPGHAIPIWKIARATSAAPSFFEPMEIDGFEFLDGGLGCNNPSWEAFQEVTCMHNESQKAIGLLLSIGTGALEFDLRGGSGWTNILQTLRAIAKVATDSTGTHEELELLRLNSELPYFRLDVEGELGNLKMDTWKRKRRTPKSGPKETNSSSESLEKNPAADVESSTKAESVTCEEDLKKHKNTQSYIRQQTAKYLKDQGVQAKLDEIAHCLVESRRERAKTARWELFASGARYRCVHKKCPSGHRYKDSVEALRKHLITRHGIHDKDQIAQYIQDGRI